MEEMLVVNTDGSTMPWDLAMLYTRAMSRLAKGLGLRDCKQLVYGRALQVWQCRWTELSKGIVAWEFCADGGDPRDAQCLGLTMEALLAGHGSMNAHLARQALAEIERCGCGAIEDWRHVLLMRDGGKYRFGGLLSDQNKYQASI